ncbi:MAG: OmpA/MotB domain protein [Bryobacterales bacterium]|nr:OmpA/MotB domain protein [Bryobacterales bacterium]
MNREAVMGALMLCALPVIGQDGGQHGTPAGSPAPIYRVTIVERTTPAINYQYRSGPTMIDFRGTVLMPQAKGSAIVESRQGRTEIDARFDKVTAPVRFGREYLTYVLWALTPDGRPHNLGEVVANASDKAKLHVTTDLQAFALIVTAEPYSAVRHPTDVVVLENAVREDTIGKIEQVQANYALLPRGQYTWNVPADLASSPKGPKVSMAQYETLLELYQAQNAVGIARAANAERYAPNTMAKAQQLFDEAQRLNNSHGDRRRVIQSARQAAETAEDARLIAERQKQEDTVNSARDEVARAQQAAAQAEDEARLAKSQAQTAQAQADAERAARERAEAEAAAARQRVAQTEAQAGASAPVNQAPSRAVVVHLTEQQVAERKSALRVRLLEELNGAFGTRDTPRGLVVTIPDADFRGNSLSSQTSVSVARISAALVPHWGLRVEVEGHADIETGGPVAARRAEEVRQTLLSHGLEGTVVSAHGMGASHPLGSNTSPGGREQNRRVEIVISGEPIGDLASWDRPYSLTSR